MHESEYDNEKFTINKEILKMRLSMEHIDGVIDRFLNNKETDQDKEDITVYALQLFYRSGKIDCTTDELTDKIHSIIVDTAIEELKQKNVLEEYFTSNGELVYNLTEEGEKIAQKLIKESQNDNL